MRQRLLLLFILALGMDQAALAQRQWTEADFRARRDVFLRQCRDSYARSAITCDTPRRQKWGDSAQCHKVWRDVLTGCEQRAEAGYQGSVENLRRRDLY